MTEETERGQPDGIGCDTDEDSKPHRVRRHLDDWPATASHPPRRQHTTGQRQHDKLQRRGSQMSLERARPRHPVNDRTRGKRGHQQCDQSQEWPQHRRLT